MNLQKHSRIRLKGKAVAELNEKIHVRDNDRCIVCGKFVNYGEKFHHEYEVKEDRVECACTLCYECHQERHFGSNGQAVKAKCREYLLRLYPVYWS